MSRIRYEDGLVEVYLWLEERIAAAEAAGIARTNILIDPGFGFGKTVAHNLELMNGLGCSTPSAARSSWAQAASGRLGRSREKPLISALGEASPSL